LTRARAGRLIEAVDHMVFERVGQCFRRHGLDCDTATERGQESFYDRCSLNPPVVEQECLAAQIRLSFQCSSTDKWREAPLSALACLAFHNFPPTRVGGEERLHWIV
jgi:hypothetical protein